MICPNNVTSRFQISSSLQNKNIDKIRPATKSLCKTYNHSSNKAKEQ